MGRPRAWITQTALKVRSQVGGSLGGYLSLGRRAEMGPQPQEALRRLKQVGGLREHRCVWPREA